MKPKKKSPSAIFRQAAEIVDRGWCQGVSALDENGRYVSCNDPKAVKFCALGAIESADRNGFNDSIKFILQLTGGIARFNDNSGTKKEDVVTALLFLSEAAR